MNGSKNIVYSSDYTEQWSVTGRTRQRIRLLNSKEEELSDKRDSQRIYECSSQDDELLPIPLDAGKITFENNECELLRCGTEMKAVSDVCNSRQQAPRISHFTNDTIEEECSDIDQYDYVQDVCVTHNKEEDDVIHLTPEDIRTVPLELEISAALSDEATEVPKLPSVSLVSHFPTIPIEFEPLDPSLPVNPGRRCNRRSVIAETRISPYYVSSDSEAFEVAEFVRIPSCARTLFIAADIHYMIPEKNGVSSEPSHEDPANENTNVNQLISNVICRSGNDVSIIGHD